jgi:hypothetical protein
LLGRAANAASALTGLAADVDGAAVRIANNHAGTNDTALSLRVQEGEAPMRVSSGAKVTDLNADQLDGKDSTGFAASTHTHSGADIASGTVDEALIDGAIARDGEIMPTVRANDGSGSGVDSDTLDGMDAPHFVDNIARTRLPINTADVDTSITDTPELLRNVGSFTKNQAESTIKLTWSGDISRRSDSTAIGFCDFQLRIDGTPPPGGSGHAVVYGASNFDQAPVATPAYFTGLAAGPHSVEIWVRGFNSTSCVQNPGQFPEEIWAEEIK